MMPDWVSKRENFSVPSRLVHDARTEVSKLYSLGEIFTIACFVDKVFFEQSQDHLCSVCGCFGATAAGLSSCQSMGVGCPLRETSADPSVRRTKWCTGLWPLAGRLPLDSGTARRVVSLGRPRLRSRPQARLLCFVGAHSQVEGPWVLPVSFQLLVWGYRASLLAESDRPPYSNSIVPKKTKNCKKFS